MIEVLFAKIFRCAHEVGENVLTVTTGKGIKNLSKFLDC